MSFLKRTLGAVLACAAIPLMAQTMDPKSATPPVAAKKPEVMVECGHPVSNITPAKIDAALPYTTHAVG